MARTNEKLWERCKKLAVRRMGGKHSARAMQLAGKIYREKGGGYRGGISKSQKSLRKWTKEKWGTRSGKNSTRGRKATGERYLPLYKRRALSKREYAATSRKKRADMKKGRQYSSQPKKIREKLARAMKRKAMKTMKAMKAMKAMKRK